MVLRESGIPERTASERNSSYTLNHNAFDDLTDEAAYWIGMLMTDGCVSDTAGRSEQIILKLQRRDREHLVKFGRFLKSDRPVLDYERLDKKGIPRPFSSICFNSRQIASAIGKFGVVPRKTYIAKAVGVEDNIHFWRGCIDGDGTVAYFSKSSPVGYPVVRFCSAGILSDQFSSFSAKTLNIQPPKLRIKDKVVYVDLNGDNAKRMVEILYPEGCVGLDRKIARVEQMKTWCPKFIRYHGAKCGYAGCDNKANSKGLCQNHYYYGKQKRLDPASVSKEVVSIFPTGHFDEMDTSSHSRRRFFHCAYVDCLLKCSKLGLCNTHMRHMLRGKIDIDKVEPRSVELWVNWFMCGRPRLKS